MDFITVLKDKVFKRYDTHIVLNEQKQYTVANYSYNHVNEQFLIDLEKDLALPIDQKNFHFGFVRQEFKGFKNSSLQSFIKQKPTIEQFDNVFHSFYKHIPVHDIMNALYIKTDYSGQAIKSIYKPYIVYILKQDFSSQLLYPSDFISTLQFNFPSNDIDYPDLKESLYSFLQKHVSLVKQHISYTDIDYTHEQLKKFETSLYNAVSKFIKPHDMKLFHCFWQNILIQKTEQHMISKIDNTFVFNLNYAYLADIYPTINNQNIALSTCHLIKHTINHYLNDFLHIHIIKEDTGFSQFVAQFTSLLKPENLPDIIDTIIELDIEYSKKNSSHSYNHHFTSQDIEPLLSQVKYLCLNNQLPPKSISNKKLKL